MESLDKQDLYLVCPYVTAQKVVADKWAVVVLHHLSGGTLRFGQLQRLMPGLTQATLTKQLRTLESSGLVRRKVYPEVPPREEYSLTPIGQAFRPVLDSIAQWGEKYIAYMQQR